MGDGYLEYLGIKEHPRGAGEERRRTVVRARRLINGDEPLGDAVHSLAEEWGLRGKRMELLAQDGVKRISRPLPKGKDRELRRMAENMLRAEEADIEQWVQAVEAACNLSDMREGCATAVKDRGYDMRDVAAMIHDVYGEA